MVTVPAVRGRDSSARRAARQQLATLLWHQDGRRRLMGQQRLQQALAACTPEDAWWVCETASPGPVYALPTRGWMVALVAWLQHVRARSVLEVAAGDGFLSACLQRMAPGLRVWATDNHAWTRPAARMGRADRKEFADVPVAGIRPLPHVLRMDAVAAVQKFKPDVTVVAWPPPGPMVAQLIRAPTRWVLEVGADGDVCGDGGASWRYHKEFAEGPLADRAWCRLDGRAQRHATVTLYYGKRHPDHGVDRGAAVMVNA